MIRRAGFALAVVLAALVLMAMSLAVGAQRAIVATHRAALAEADAELTAVVADAGAAINGTAVAATGDTARSPGSVLASGVGRVGMAVAAWQVTRVAASLAMADVTAERRTTGGVARARRSALLRLVTDSAGTARLRVLAPDGWVVLPSP